MKYPPGAAARIDRMLRERERLERRHLRLARADAEQLEATVRELVAQAGNTSWSLTAHARVMRHVRAAGRAFGVALSARARAAAVAAVTLGAEHQPRAMAVFASAALGKRLAAPTIDLPAAIATALPDVDARTEDVGARSGDDTAQAVIGASYLETRKVTPLPAVALAAGLAALALNRARERAERVIVTEMTAGAAEGGDAARVMLARRWPKMKVSWDSTLDKRACRLCAELHHKVVDMGAEFAAGVSDAPAHARCRCCTWPHLDEWSEMLEGIAPGPRTGVVGSVEVQLGSFTERAPDWYIESR